MLFRPADLEGIEAGRITLAFRRWTKPRAVVGGTQRTRIGVIELTAIDRVKRPTNKDARAAGYRDAQHLLDSFAGREGDLYRIALHLAGPDPRIALRELPPDDAVFAKLDRMGEWTYEYLQAIADNPGKRAPDLAIEFGRETAPFKRDVRKLKELGLTISLEIGYELSKRGQLTLSSRPNALRKTSP
ncbi:hypothetical protein [Solirubrobacter soli]|uniref:hypothetical protein n=1 Tax=Solirubrobacter soli TaxID=363832 RepID=UPI00047F447E|nr:hypothetical protein [Solirubrobacter soli]